MVAHRRTLGLIVAGALVAFVACSTYGGEDAPSSAPDRDAGADTIAPANDAASNEDAGGLDASEAGAARCDRALPFGDPNVVPGLTTDNYEGHARFTGDELQVFFARYDGNWDIWTASRAKKDDAFAGTVKLALPNTDAGADLDPAPSFDGLRLYFATDREANGFDIWMAARATTDDAFAAPAKLAEANVTEDDRRPYVAPDGKSIWFDSARSGANRIYRMNLSTLGVGTPELVPLLPEASTIEDESPVISSDGLALYFGSRGRDGSDQTYVYMATRSTTAAAFGTPVKVSKGTDYAVPTFITPDECRLYLTVSGLTGGTRISMAERPR